MLVSYRIPLEQSTDFAFSCRRVFGKLRGGGDGRLSGLPWCESTGLRGLDQGPVCHRCRSLKPISKTGPNPHPSPVRSCSSVGPIVASASRGCALSPLRGCASGSEHRGEDGRLRWLPWSDVTGLIGWDQGIRRGRTTAWSILIRLGPWQGPRSVPCPCGPCR